MGAIKAWRDKRGREIVENSKLRLKIKQRKPELRSGNRRVWGGRGCFKMSSLMVFIQGETLRRPLETADSPRRQQSPCHVGLFVNQHAVPEFQRWRAAINARVGHPKIIRGIMEPVPMATDQVLAAVAGWQRCWHKSAVEWNRNAATRLQEEKNNRRVRAGFRQKRRWKCLSIVSPQ